MGRVGLDSAGVAQMVYRFENEMKEGKRSREWGRDKIAG